VTTEATRRPSALAALAALAVLTATPVALVLLAALVLLSRAPASVARCTGTGYWGIKKGNKKGAGRYKTKRKKEEIN
jgi:hypothetical protein